MAWPTAGLSPSQHGPRSAGANGHADLVSVMARPLSKEGTIQPRVEMFGEFLGEEGREADGAAGGGGLGWFPDPKLAAREVESVGA